MKNICRRWSIIASLTLLPVACATNAREEPAQDSAISVALSTATTTTAPLLFLDAHTEGPDGDGGVQQAVADAMPRVVRAYRRIHENPELGRMETKTHDFIEAELRAIGFGEFVASKREPTAVIAILRTGRPGPTIALRAEMDARKLKDLSEPVDHDPCSQVSNVMHNCGHDAHAAMLLGAAEALLHLRDRLTGTIVFLFQPAEEVAGGADKIVEEGILQGLHVDAIFAQHSAPGMPVGTISLAPGCTMAGSSYFTITIEGKESHAADPSAGGDVPVVAAETAALLPRLPARKWPITTHPVVISVTFMSAGSEENLNTIPRAAVLKGTIRAFEDIEASPAPKVASVADDLRTVLRGIAATYGVTITLELKRGSPPLCNDRTLVARTTGVLRNQWKGAFVTEPERLMFSEDFAYYTPVMSAAYFGLGIAKDDMGLAGVHSAAFTIHPDALVHGVRLLALLGFHSAETVPPK